MTITRCDLNDASILEGLFSVLYKPELKWSRELIEQEIRSGRKIYFIALEEDVLGAFGIELEEREAKFGPISIKPQYQKRGVGSQLIRFAESLARGRGLVRIWCHSLERYHTEGFYEYHGWKMEKFIKDFWDGQNCYLFSKEL
ncbi:MAG: GNAT family N-acetyltransferase [Nanoarchaeota archaeon]|nr:GNAT family N-acetyltransferase [Nanoarchaeota archaeon]